MSVPAVSRRPRLVVSLVAAGVLVASVFSAEPAANATSAGSGGHRTPAIGIRPHYTVAGRVTPGVVPTFSCQLTTPANCYGPAQIRAAYGVDQLSADGKGTTIAIVDAFQSPTIQHDVDTFDALFNLPAVNLAQIAPQGLTPFDSGNADMVGWAGEITLDVEWAHAIAPKATIRLVLARSDADADILAATKWVVDHSAADVLSQSFGEAEQCVDPSIQAQQQAMFVRARQKRITAFASSGDQGAAQPTCDGSTFFKATSSPASDPNVTGVGGTRLDANGITGAYNGETVWNEPGFQAAGGGGYSVVYRTPGYQASRHLPSRGVPDVSYNAAINGGVLAVWSSSGDGPDLVFRFGGTSAGSPQWAGLTALADQMGHGRVGMLNSWLYGITSSPTLYPQLFHDVTVGDNTYFGDVTVGGFSATPGWDAASGLGTPKANVLVPRMATLG